MVVLEPVVLPPVVPLVLPVVVPLVLPVVVVVVEVVLVVLLVVPVVSPVVLVLVVSPVLLVLLVLVVLTVVEEGAGRRSGKFPTEPSVETLASALGTATSSALDGVVSFVSSPPAALPTAKAPPNTRAAAPASASPLPAGVTRNPAV